MKKRLQILGTAALVVSFGFAAPLSATAASFDDGFAVSGNASPALPSCTEEGVFEEFTISGLGDPYSDASGANEPLGSNRLALVKSRDRNFPWALKLIAADGGELRYDSDTSTWIGSDDPAFRDADQWSSAGLLYGRSAEGRYYVSYDTEEGVFLADSDPGDSVSYTPTDEFNVCIEQAAVLKGSVRFSAGSSESTPTDDSPTVSALAFSGLDGETVTLFSALGVGAILSGAGLFIARRRASR
jgi:hypothetical protein